ncbi:hypothetical protein J6P92_08310 [bacterium]|nr:hypothetical protein [bacterium]
MKKRFIPPALPIDYDAIEIIENNEAQIILTNDILKEFALDVDKTKIDNFKDINFVSIFEE